MNMMKQTIFVIVGAAIYGFAAYFFGLKVLIVIFVAHLFGLIQGIEISQQ